MSHEAISCFNEPEYLLGIETHEAISSSNSVHPGGFNEPEYLLGIETILENVAGLLTRGMGSFNEPEYLLGIETRT